MREGWICQTCRRQSMAQSHPPQEDVGHEQEGGRQKDRRTKRLARLAAVAARVIELAHVPDDPAAGAGGRRGQQGRALGQGAIAGFGVGA